MEQNKWKITYTHPTESGIANIIDSNGNDIATAFLSEYPGHSKSLEFMLRAVNNHDALVAALSNLVNRIENLFDQEDLPPHILIDAKSLLSLDLS